MYQGETNAHGNPEGRSIMTTTTYKYKGTRGPRFCRRGHIKCKQNFYV